METTLNKDIKETQAFDNEKPRIDKAKKMMLWFGMISLVMSFAGLTSAYFVSKEREDWLENFELPQAFYLSLMVIILSSITFHFAKRSIVAQENKKGLALLILTFVLGSVFVFLQFRGFNEIIEAFGFNPTGPTSNITFTFIYLIAFLHIVHVIAALIVVLVVIYNHSKQKYTKENTVGIEIAVTFWHFVDVLWIYLFLFFYFVR